MNYRNITTEEIIRQLLKNIRPRYNAQANDSLAVSRARERGVVSRGLILGCIDELIAEGKLIYSPKVAAALQDAKEKHPYNNFSKLAFEKRVLDKAEEIGFSVTSAQDLSDVMDWVLENDDNVPLSAAGEELQQQQRGIEQRTNEINEITNNYTSGFKIRTPNGGIKVYDKDGFEIQFSSSGGRSKPKDGGFDVMTNDEIHSIYKQVTEQRRLQSLSREELRAEINPQRQKALEASSTSLGPNPAGVELVLDGKVITTKRELINAINSSNDATKRMLTRNGVTDRTLARHFEELLNS